MRSFHDRRVTVLGSLLAAALVSGVTCFGGAAGAVTVAQAKTHLLVLSDLPSGWKVEGAASSGSGNFPGSKQLAQCIGVSPKLITANPPEANSPYFSNSSGQLEVQESISVFPSAKNAQAEYRAMANPKTPGCLTTIFNTPAIKAKLAGQGGQGAKVGTVSVSKLSDSLPRGSVGFTVKLPISSQGVNVTAILTSVVYVKGTLGAQLLFNSYNSSFPASLASQLARVGIGRL